MPVFGGMTGGCGHSFLRHSTWCSKCFWKPVCYWNNDATVQLLHAKGDDRSIGGHYTNVLSSHRLQ